jgi:PAS domain S-box-containing protein
MIKNYFNSVFRFIKKPVTAGVLVFIGCLCITVIVTWQRYLIFNNIQQRELTSAANTVKDKIEDNLRQGAQAASTLSFIVKNYGVGNNFDSIASEILRSHKNVDVIQLVKGGIITHVYPLKGNEAAIGFDILADTTVNKGIYQAVERKEMYYGGPFKLVIGGRGIVINLPIYIDNNFWGFSTVIIKLPTLIRSANLENDPDSEYSFQLSRVRPRTNKEEFYLPGAEKFKKDLSVDVAITEGKWKIYASFNRPQTFFSPIPFLIIGFLLSIAAGLFIWDKTRQPQKLKKLVDEQSSLLNNAFELSAIGMALVSLDGKWMKINEELCKMLGYTKEELLSITFSTVTHPDDVEGTLRFVADAIEGKVDTYRVEKRYIRKDGSIVWGKVHSRIVKDDKGKPLHFVAQIEDITVRKKAEEKLRESEERHRSIVSVTGAWEYQADIGYLWCSPEYYSMLGRDAENYNITGDENLREVWFDLLHPEDRERAVEEFTEYLKNGSIGIYESAYRVLHSNGSWVWIWSRGQNLRDAEGNITHLTVGTLIDITERKKAEEKLRESEERYKSIIAVSNTGAWEYHHDTDYTWCSPEYFSMLGLNHADYDLTGNKNIKEIWIELLHPDDVEHARTRFRDYLKNGSVGIYENYFRMRHANGSWVWIWSRGQSLRDAKGNVTNLTLGTHIDITERKLAEEKLRESELRFREVLENSIAASYKRSLLTNSYEYLSPVFKKIAGYTQDEMNSLPLETVIGMMHPDDVQSVTEGITKALTELNGMPNFVEYRFKHKTNDEYRWLKDEFVIMQDEKGLAVALIGSVSDVTEQKESELHFKNLVEKSLVGVYMLQKGKFIYVNPKFAQDLGYTQEEMLNLDNAQQIVYDEYKPDELLQWRKKVEAGIIEDFHIELKYKRKDGEVIWAEVYCGETLHRGTKAILGTFQDITERKNAAIKLEQSEERHRALVQNIGDGIVLLNENREIIYQSTSVDRINGFSVEERLGKPAGMLLHPYDKPAYVEFLNKVYNSPGEPMQCQFRIQHRKGHYIWVEGSMVNMLNNESVKAIIVNYHDITERKKATELFKYQFENTPDTIMFIRKDLTVESINKGQPPGFSNEEMSGINSLELLPEESRDIAREFLIRCFETGQNFEHELTLKFSRWSYFRYVPIIIDGEVAYVMVIGTDITERKLAELKLKESEEKHRALIENISDAIILMNDKLNTVYRSPSVRRIIGYSPREIRDKEIFDLLHPNDLKTTRNLFQKARNTPGVAIQGQFRVLHNSGHYIWVEGTVMNMLHIKSINALIVNFREITERKKFEEQQLLMTSIVNSSDDAIISKDLNGIITSWNKGAEKIFGYASEEMIGKLIYTIIPAELKAEEEIFLTKIKKGNSVDHYETRRCRKDGVLIDVSLTISPIKDSAGNIVGASKILSDITERKKAAEAIKQSEANYRQLFDNSPAPMWVIDEQTHAIVQVNQACIKNYGYSEEEFLGLNIRDISPNNEGMQDSKNGMNGMFFMGSQWHVKKSGELINVLTSSIPIRLNGEKSILMIAIDVTEKNLYEQKLTKAAIKAQEDERYEIGGELHDNVCQMLAGSLMFLGLMKGSLPDKSTELFDLAYKNITSATNEIRNLSHRLAPAFFDEETLEDAFKRLLKEFNIENKYDIKLFLDKNVKQQSLGRDQQLNLYRILQEQLRNIVKHAKATEIEVEVLLKKKVLQMRISDNGIGFDMKQVKGGIGLANMNRRAQLFAGTFRIDSIVGKGSEAVVEIPLAYND